VSKATELGVMLHEGKMYGWVNQLLILFICLMGAVEFGKRDRDLVEASPAKRLRRSAPAS
jgi:uncharacterized iron-regulated membrane protein